VLQKFATLNSVNIILRAVVHTAEKYDAHSLHAKNSWFACTHHTSLCASLADPQHANIAEYVAKISYILCARGGSRSASNLRTPVVAHERFPKVTDGGNQTHTINMAIVSCQADLVHSPMSASVCPFCRRALRARCT
jgi:hypothetical protein